MLQKICSLIFKKARINNLWPAISERRKQHIYAKKAQHTIELTLIIPFIILFIGIIFEIALVIHTNYKFNSALYEAISLMALTDKINTSKEESVNNTKEYAKILLNQRLAPYSNSLDVKLIETGDLDFLIGTYKYTSTFTILNTFREFTIGTYDFLTIIPINSAVFRKNSYNIENSFFEDGTIEIKKQPQNPDESVEDSGTEDSATKKDSESFDVEIPEADI